MGRPKRSWRQQLEHARKERARHQRKNRPEERDKPRSEQTLTAFGRWLFDMVKGGAPQRAEDYRPYVEAARSTNDAAIRYLFAMRYNGDAVKEANRVGKDIERLAKNGWLDLPWKPRPRTSEELATRTKRQRRP